VGTRSDTIIFNEDGKEICVLGSQFDGYLDGHGRDLKCFLRGRKIIHGYTDKNDKNFNGMDCMAASLVAHFKKRIGEFYLHAPGWRNGDYHYHITKDGDNIKVTAKRDDEILEEWSSGED